MDVIGYVFLGVAVIALISGLVEGFASILFAFLSLAGSIAVAIIFTPTVCQMEMVQNLIEDTPIVIGGQEIFYLRTVIVFAILAFATLLAVLILKGIFKAILKRAKALKFIDRLIGGAFNVAIVWAVFGVIFALSNTGTEWLLELEEQVTASGIQLPLAQPIGDVLTAFNSSQILQTVYSAFNPVGELVAGLLFA